MYSSALWSKCLVTAYNVGPLFMENTPINEVEAHKHLGLFLSNDCSWHQHINYIKDKAWARINIMRRLKYKLDRKSLESIYISFIRPLLEYGDTIWDNCTQYEKYELDKIQSEAARIASYRSCKTCFPDQYIQRNRLGIILKKTKQP